MSTSEANGALMRIAPLAIFGHHRLNPTRVAVLAQQEARLSHKNVVCQVGPPPPPLPINRASKTALLALEKTRGRGGGGVIDPTLLEMALGLGVRFPFARQNEEAGRNGSQEAMCCL
jgi:hypothetical protein